MLFTRLPSFTIRVFGADRALAVSIRVRRQRASSALAPWLSTGSEHRLFCRERSQIGAAASPPIRHGGLLDSSAQIGLADRCPRLFSHHPITMTLDPAASPQCPVNGSQPLMSHPVTAALEAAMPSSGNHLRSRRRRCCQAQSQHHGWCGRAPQSIRSIASQAAQMERLTQHRPVEDRCQAIRGAKPPNTGGSTPAPLRHERETDTPLSAPRIRHFIIKYRGKRENQDKPTIAKSSNGHVATAQLQPVWLTTPSCALAVDRASVALGAPPRTERCWCALGPHRPRHRGAWQAGHDVRGSIGLPSAHLPG